MKALIAQRSHTEMPGGCEITTPHMGYIPDSELLITDEPFANCQHGLHSPSTTASLHSIIRS